MRVWQSIEPSAARAILLLPVLLVCARAQEPADLILHNGKIVTVARNFSIAQAIVVREGRIVAVGDESVVKRYRSSNTIDLHGHAVLPGFDDVHLHLNGDPPYYVELADARSIQEIQNLVRAKAQHLDKEAWVTGAGWAEDQLEEKRKPTAKDLDAAAPDNPVVLTRAGGHSVVVNSRALALAGITRDTPDPARGVIEHLPNGDPSGVVREGGGMFMRFTKRPSAAELRDSLVLKIRRLLSLGITSFVLAGMSIEEWNEWQAIYRAQGETLPRAAIQIRYPGAERLQAFAHKTGDGDERLRLGAIKIFVDGGFTGPAAYTIEPYKGQGDYRGKLTMTPQELYEEMSESHRLGWQLGLHTIGDGAIQLAVDTFDRILRESPRNDHRHYLTHFSMTPPSETMRKMAADHIWIAQQPNFTYTLEGRYRDNLEGDRLQLNNPIVTPIKYGIFMCFSSDILPIGPMVGLYAAVTRKGMSGAVYGPGERVSMREAITMYTRNGPYFTWEENLKGTLESGKLADMIVFEDDPLTVIPDRLLSAKVQMTIVGGRIVYQARPAKGDARETPLHGEEYSGNREKKVLDKHYRKIVN